MGFPGCGPDFGTSGTFPMVSIGARAQIPSRRAKKNKNRKHSAGGFPREQHGPRNPSFGWSMCREPWWTSGAGILWGPSPFFPAILLEKLRKPNENGSGRKERSKRMEWDATPRGIRKFNTNEQLVAVVTRPLEARASFCFLTQTMKRRCPAEAKNKYCPKSSPLYHVPCGFSK